MVCFVLETLAVLAESFGPAHLAEILAFLLAFPVSHLVVHIVVLLVDLEILGFVVRHFVVLECLARVQFESGS